MESASVVPTPPTPLDRAEANEKGGTMSELLRIVSNHCQCVASRRQPKEAAANLACDVRAREELQHVQTITAQVYGVLNRPG